MKRPSSQSGPHSLRAWNRRVCLLLTLLIIAGLPGFTFMNQARAQEGSPSASPGPSASTASSPSQVNAELILDSSGSMAEATSDGEPRI
ncbi:MAG TPA: hypothetical protein VGT61_00015, partial [Thermomicrobiales bacterium]|nr:hypothetical protein [Thermomicrobiales bacterium]